MALAQPGQGWPCWKEYQPLARPCQGKALHKEHVVFSQRLFLRRQAPLSQHIPFPAPSCAQLSPGSMDLLKQNKS